MWVGRGVGGVGGCVKERCFFCVVGLGGVVGGVAGGGVREGGGNGGTFPGVGGGRALGRAAPGVDLSRGSPLGGGGVSTERATTAGSWWAPQRASKKEEPRWVIRCRPGLVQACSTAMHTRSLIDWLASFTVASKKKAGNTPAPTLPQCRSAKKLAGSGNQERDATETNIASFGTNQRLRRTNPKPVLRLRPVLSQRTEEGHGLLRQQPD